jgi:ABC-2 type transport system ATP-binding protein
MHAVRTEHLEKTYRVWRSSARALAGLDLAVPAGEIFGYLGSNGAGKTTTLKLLMGLARPTAGRAWLFGRPVEDSRARRGVGFMAEHPYFPPYLNVEEILTACGRLAGVDRGRARREAEEILQRTGLGAVAGHRVHRLSKGMLQWLGLAQALAGRPRLIILDEPMSGLDPIGRRRMRDLILEERARGTTVLFSSHILADVELICDRVGILRGGELIHCGPLHEILDRGAEGVEIRALGVPAALGARIRTLGGTVRAFGEETLVYVEGAHRADLVLGWLCEGGARVHSLAPRRESLEEFFLRQMRGPREGRDRDGRPASEDEPGARVEVGAPREETVQAGSV